MTALVAALIGVFGALSGVAFTEWRRVRARERLATERRRGAARMVSAEFGSAAIIADSPRPFWILGTLPSVAWQAHGADLARALSDDDFEAVVDAAQRIEGARNLAAGITDPSAMVAALPAVTLAPLVEKCRRAQDVLRPLAYPGDSQST